MCARRKRKTSSVKIKGHYLAIKSDEVIIDLKFCRLSNFASFTTAKNNRPVKPTSPLHISYSSVNMISKR